MSFKVENRTVMYWLINLMIFLPRSIYVAGMQSFRLPAILCLVLILLLNRFRIEMRGCMRNPFIWVYFSYVCIRFCIAGSISTGIGWIIDSIFVMYCSMESIRSLSDFKKFCNLFSNILNIYCIFGLVECLTGFNIWATITNTTLVGIRYGLHRTYGSFENYMNNGTFLVLSLVLVMWSIQNINKKKYIVTYILILLNILATITRASIIGAVILQCIWLLKIGILKSLKKHLKSILLALLLLVIVIQLPQVKIVTHAIMNMFLAVLDPSVAADMASTFGGNAKGTGERLELYKWVWESIDNKWLGAGATTAFAYEWVTPTGRTALKWSIENQGLAVLFKYGLLGLTLYILMMMSILYNTAKSSRFEIIGAEIGNKHQLTLSFMSISAICVYIFMGFFHAYLGEFRFFFVLIGVMSGYINALRVSCINEL